MREEIRAVLAEQKDAKRRKQPEDPDDSDESDDSDASVEASSSVLSQMLSALQGTGDGKAEHVSR